MKMGIVIYSADVEPVWNAFRVGNFALVMGDEVKVFLIGKGVKVESLDSDKFKINEQLQAFGGAGGKIWACGTCLEIHRIKPTKTYTVATLKDIYEIVKESDKLLTF